MNTGYVVLALGVLAALLGVGMRAAKWHGTIGLGGIGIGIVLILVGAWFAWGTKPQAKTQPMQPTTPS